jgi:hypothetical protein
VFRGLGLQGKYAFSIYRVGSILAPTDTGASFFDTLVHTWSAGPRLELTREDSISLLYQQSLISQTQTSGAGSVFETNTQSVTANYSRITPSWTFTMAGGVTLVEPASLAFPTGNIRVSTNTERSTMVQIDLSRLAAPSFYLSAGAMISNVAQAQVIHRLEKHLTLRAGANYGFNEVIPVESNTKFTNLTLSVGLNYRVSKTLFVDLYYDHNDFKTDSPGISYVLLRDVVGISLTAEWR